MRCSPGVPEGERQSGSIQKDFTFEVLLDACRCRALKRILTQLSFPYSHTIMRMNSKCLNLFLVLGLAACASSGTPAAPEPVAPAEVASHLPRRIVDAMSSGLPVRHATIQRNLMTKRSSVVGVVVQPETFTISSPQLCLRMLRAVCLQRSTRKLLLISFR